jgi:GT2 family glycosyltransferase
MVYKHLEQSPFVSAVIPNLNGGDFVLRAIDSILNLNYSPQRLEIIIVDNNSADNSLQRIKEAFAPQIDSKKLKLIELDSNLGAPAAYNVGINNANKNFEYIFKLDNDVILDKDSLTELVNCAESESKIGMVGGKVFYLSDKKRLHLIGSRLRAIYGGGIGIGKYKLDNQRYAKDLTMDAVNGCMLLVKKSLIDEIGLMDEKYFLYFDDLDWALRAQSKGYQSIFRHKALAYHNTSLPYKRFRSKTWLYYAIYNSFYFMKKNYTGMDRFLFLLATHIRLLCYMFGVIRHNNLSKQRDLLKVVFDSYWRGMRYLWKKG